MYEVPSIKPKKVKGELKDVSVVVGGELVISKGSEGFNVELPTLVGLTHEIVALLIPDVAFTNVGGPGGPMGVTAVDVADALVPMALVDATRRK